MNVLSIQSQVVYGHVGNSAAAFVLQRQGHAVWQVPTITSGWYSYFALLNVWW